RSETAVATIGDASRQRGGERTARAGEREERDAVLAQFEAAGELERRGRPEHVEGEKEQRLPDRPAADQGLPSPDRPQGAEELARLGLPRRLAGRQVAKEQEAEGDGQRHRAPEHGAPGGAMGAEARERGGGRG